jgi:hypothetical protein
MYARASYLWYAVLAAGGSDATTSDPQTPVASALDRGRTPPTTLAGAMAGRRTRMIEL